MIPDSSIPKGVISQSTCQHEKTDCVDSRKQEGYRYRRHVCRKCKHKFTTVEVPIETQHGTKSIELLKEQMGISDNQRTALKNLIDAFDGEL